MVGSSSQDPTVDRQPFVLRPGSGVGIGLPATLTSFIGRERESRQLLELIRQPDMRLVTIVGPGGVGKTRLCIEVARRAASGFAGGVAFVDLSTLASAELIEPAVARALGMREQANRPLAERVADIFGDRHLLLVIDNFEPFVSSSPLASEILARCPNMTAMVTSREPLRLSAERVVEIPPLSLPDPRDQRGAPTESEAVRLFVDRAAAIRTDFALNDANSAAVAEIVRRVDGLPLAVELAAARIAHLPPAKLLERLDRRLPMLTGGARDLPERQRTLRSAIAWSYDLLTKDEQRAFRTQAVFAGGCRLEAAEALARPETEDVVLDLLGSLVSRSLLRQEEDEDGEPRFRMLDTVREFGVEQLAVAGEEHTARNRHARYFLDLAEQADVEIWEGPNAAWWLDRLEDELPNLEAALQWLDRSGEGARFLRLAASLGGLWQFRSHHTQGRAWLKRALEIGGESEPAPRAMAYVKLSMMERVVGGADAADYAMQGLALRRQMGDPGWIGAALHHLANVYRYQAEYDRALPLFEEAERYYESAGDLGGLAGCRTSMARVLIELGDIARGRQLVTDALRLHRQRGFDFGTASALLVLGTVEADSGHTAEAADRYAESLRLWTTIKNSEGTVETLAAVASLAMSAGHTVPATRLLGAASSLADSLSLVAPPPSRRRLAETAVRIRSELGDRVFDVRRNEGRTMTSAAAVTEALEVLERIRSESRPAANARGDLRTLTPREQSVLRLVVEGLTDREIAQQLGLSYRSVTSYVRNILTKLDAPSRTAAATSAVRRGLI